jgi:nucleotide-binding universal stress UspA family protein
MRRTIIVGYDGRERAADGLALGRVLAAPLEAEFVAACVHSTGLDWPPPAPDWERLLAQEAAKRLAAIPDGASIRKETIGSSSPARGLLEFAEREQAELLVVGSSHRGALGAALLGSVARSLLHGAPCGVAVAPSGFARAAAVPTLIGVGFDDSAESWHALQGAIRIAESCRARLRLIAVLFQGEVHPKAAGLTGEWDPVEGLRDALQRKLGRALRRVPAALRANGHVILGSPDDTLRHEATRDIELLVLGSRGYGPLRRVLLGSVASALVGSAPCPVIVFPRGSEVDLPDEPAATGGATTAS